MHRKLYGITAAALLAGSLAAAAPAIAQNSGSAQSGNASSGQSSQMGQRNDNDRDWGWLGLLGLIGLAGLRGRRRDADVRRDTEAVNRTGAYNR
jgi:MYXO-CTERM domain-containing protein